MAGIQEKYRTLVEIAPSAIFLVDQQSGTIVEANDRAATLLGYDLGTLEGMNVIAIHPSDDTDRYEKLFERTITGGTVRTRTLDNGDPVCLETSTGIHIPVEIHAKTVQIDDREWIYAIVRDVTEQHEYERQLERQNDHLEDFANIVAHDLRNPLNVAQLRVGLAREELDSDHLPIASDALSRMEALVDDTLTLARQGQAITDPEEIDLTALLEQCWSIVDAAEATLVLDVESDVRVRGDRDRLRQVFENLFRNARDHADDPPTVTVSVTDSGIRVDDDGPGIPPAKREDVFEAGYTTDPTGTGFGLAIIEKICAAHGWDVSVAENDSGGARFEITTPETEPSRTLTPTEQ